MGGPPNGLEHWPNLNLNRFWICTRRVVFDGNAVMNGKRRKITHPPPPRRTLSSSTADKARDVALATPLTVPVAQPPETIWIQTEKKLAVEQAQREGCTGNFRSFDSQFKNYLVPVIPTRKELAE